MAYLCRLAISGMLNFLLTIFDDHEYEGICLEIYS